MPIKNFGKVTESIYRGAQPKDGEYWTLRTHAIKTVLDLRDDPESYAKQRVEECHLTYINLPMSSSRRPGPEFPAAFFNVVNDRSLGPVYVHCAGGRHRTGIMVAAWRIEFQGWGLNRAMKELESYDFGWLKWRWAGHRALKSWLEDYALHMQKEE